MKHKIIFDGADLRELVAAKLHLQNLEVQQVVFRGENGDEVPDDLISVEVEAKPSDDLKVGCVLCDGVPRSVSTAAPELDTTDATEAMTRPPPIDTVFPAPVEDLDEELGESLDAPEYEGASLPPGAVQGSPHAAAAAGRRLAQSKPAPFSRRKLTGGIGGESTKPPRGGR